MPRSASGLDQRYSKSHGGSLYRFDFPTVATHRWIVVVLARQRCKRAGKIKLYRPAAWQWYHVVPARINCVPDRPAGQPGPEPILCSWPWKSSWKKCTGCTQLLAAAFSHNIFNLLLMLLSHKKAERNRLHRIKAAVFCGVWDLCIFLHTYRIIVWTTLVSTFKNEFPANR